MAKIIQFPHGKMTHEKSIQSPIQTSTPLKVDVVSLGAITDCLDDLNDTLKYVTDGLYAITLEIKETKECIASDKSILFLAIFLLFILI